MKTVARTKISSKRDTEEEYLNAEGQFYGASIAREKLIPKFIIIKTSENIILGNSRLINTLHHPTVIHITISENKMLYVKCYRSEPFSITFLLR